MVSVTTYNFIIGVVFFSNIFCSRYDFVLSIALMYLIILWVCGWTANKATTSTSFCIVALKVSHEEPQSSFSVNLQKYY
jgi:uncharacterized membrane protein YqjE